MLLKPLTSLFVCLLSTTAFAPDHSSEDNHTQPAAENHLKRQGGFRIPEPKKPRPLQRQNAISEQVASTMQILDKHLNQQHQTASRLRHPLVPGSPAEFFYNFYLKKNKQGFFSRTNGPRPFNLLVGDQPYQVRLSRINFTKPPTADYYDLANSRVIYETCMLLSWQNHRDNSLWEIEVDFKLPCLSGSISEQHQRPDNQAKILSTFRLCEHLAICMQTGNYLSFSNALKNWGISAARARNNFARQDFFLFDDQIHKTPDPEFKQLMFSLS